MVVLLYDLELKGSSLYMRPSYKTQRRHYVHEVDNRFERMLYIPITLSLHYLSTCCAVIYISFYNLDRSVHHGIALVLGAKTVAQTGEFYKTCHYYFICYFFSQSTRPVWFNIVNLLPLHLPAVSCKSFFKWRNYRGYNKHNAAIISAQTPNSRKLISRTIWGTQQANINLLSR